MPCSRALGTLEQLWGGLDKKWGELIDRQREKYHWANWHIRYCKLRGYLEVGQAVWLWNTKMVTL